ncbi:MIP/aquaporin family protein [Vibrio cincinnatiensis]|jgi:glycerol uptake facilitator protein|uniref:Glycerol uptake facilitator protein n=1 Tax=Vibrio cincinnatiensis DSM 19608 TaxID=1123491 RepID=A0A1T4S146_VIBCI|nr:MIP/aquaporin family protein [Vibrio cincinnatiensis]MCG3723161.1 aquaporin family protein [Vibrio cincinnatiensis]MCG3726181.1 aquaporin family protein [Vibrio cincinnatiensis]MCG3733774.1 aquaporin family protein [Vibrio cincinnatiensis]MCG3736658.1 aquaporin family protein [Vibrio cincinnatiensis]MCG3740958.1 aquaporin family protein [Vibrio cincinnatiensis]
MARTKQQTLLGECIAEFIGTGLLIFFGVGCVAALVLTNAQFGQWEISIIWGLGVAIAIYCTAGVSGAHINPAVTIALAAFHGFNKAKVIPYIVAQLFGAFCAAALVYSLYSNLFVDYEIAHSFTRNSQEALATAGIFSTYSHASISFSGAMAVEFVITAVLMFGILALGDENNGAHRNALNPLLIGVLIAIIGGSLGPLTGFAMNPARDFGPKLFAYLAGWDYALSGAKEIPYFIVPIVAPIAGACFGAWAYPKFIAVYLPKVGTGCTIPNQCDNVEESEQAHV